MLKMLVPLDGSGLAMQAVPHAVLLARSFESEVHLLQVLEKKAYDLDPSLDDLDWELRRMECQHYLGDLQHTLDLDGVNIRLHVREGDPASEIIELCRQEDIDLVVVTAYGVGGITRFPQGSTVQKIISRAEQSLLIVPPEPPERATSRRQPLSYDRILVALDGSKRADWALYLASGIARMTDATLSLLQVVQEPKVTPGVRTSAEGRELVDRLMELTRRDSLDHLRDITSQLPAGLEVETRLLVAAEVAPVVVAVAREEAVDLLVLSAHGIADGDRAFTAVTEQIIGEAACPVLVFQDARNKRLILQPRSGEPVRSSKVQADPDRAHAS
ncbi:MAG: universal stress protein [Gammaproteobacteria bacterium]|jgi:nucleotide-binding universal stress UspA family protein